MKIKFISYFQKENFSNKIITVFFITFNDRIANKKI